MTDREMLELAAKAAGIPIVECTCSNPVWPFRHDEAKSGKHGHWSPLANDGDALRLAATLLIDVHQAADEPGVIAVAMLQSQFIEPCTPETRTAATRRAITRAAAAIGKAMQETTS